MRPAKFYPLLKMDNEYVLFHLQAIGRRETALCIAENGDYGGNLKSLETAFDRIHKEHNRLRKRGGDPLTKFLAAPFQFPVGSQMQKDRRYDNQSLDMAWSWLGVFWG